MRRIFEDTASQFTSTEYEHPPKACTFDTKSPLEKLKPNFKNNIYTFTELQKILTRIMILIDEIRFLSLNPPCCVRCANALFDKAVIYINNQLIKFKLSPNTQTITIPKLLIHYMHMIIVVHWHLRYAAKKSNTAINTCDYLFEHH